MADIKLTRQREETDEGMSSQTQSHTPQWFENGVLSDQGDGKKGITYLRNILP